MDKWPNLESIVEGFVSFLLRFGNTILFLLFRPRATYALVSEDPDDRKPFVSSSVLAAIGGVLVAMFLSRSDGSTGLGLIARRLEAELELRNFIQIAVPLTLLAVVWGTVMGRVVGGRGRGGKCAGELLRYSAAVSYVVIVLAFVVFTATGSERTPGHSLASLLQTLAIIGCMGVTVVGLWGQPVSDPSRAKVAPVAKVAVGIATLPVAFYGIILTLNSAEFRFKDPQDWVVSRYIDYERPAGKGMEMRLGFAVTNVGMADLVLSRSSVIGLSIRASNRTHSLPVTSAKWPSGEGPYVVLKPRATEWVWISTPYRPDLEYLLENRYVPSDFASVSILPMYVHPVAGPLR